MQIVHCSLISWAKPVTERSVKKPAKLTKGHYEVYYFIRTVNSFLIEGRVNTYIFVFICSKSYFKRKFWDRTQIYIHIHPSIKALKILTNQILHVQVKTVLKLVAFCHSNDWASRRPFCLSA